MSFFDFLNFLFHNDDNCPFKRNAENKLEEEQIDFFYPNACQVCGSLGYLSRCSRCQMVSYCGKQHQTEHWKLHKYLCPLLSGLRKKDGFLRGAKDRKQEAWANAKIACINNLSKKLGRVLTSYEEKVIKFTRACCICHDIDQTNLINCPNCASVSICRNHKDRFQQIHDKEKCANFKLCYSFDFEKFEEAKKTKLNNSKDEDKDSNNSEDSENSDKSHIDYKKSNLKISELKSMSNEIPYFGKFPGSTLEFMEILSFRPFDKGVKMEDFEIPELMIKTLNVFRSLQLLDQLKMKELTIHLIGAQVCDLENYNFWEILFHLIPMLKKLKIVIVHSKIATQCLNPKLCDKCIDNERELIFQMKTQNYHDFIKENSKSMISLVIGFSISLKMEIDALKAIGDLKIPLALTSNEKKIAYDNHKVMGKLFGKLIARTFFEKNSFCGVKPILDYKSEGVYYQHQYLTIYKDYQQIVNKQKNGVPK